MKPGKPIAVLINPNAGSGRMPRIQKQLLGFLQVHAPDFILFENQWPEKLDDYRQVLLVGGDGTVNFFINQYPDCNIPIGLVAAGSGNDFAWKIFGRTTVEEQLRKAVLGDLHPVDAGICNGRYFLNGAGIGFDGAVVQNMNRENRWLKGWLAYYSAVIKTICLYRSRNMQLLNDENLLITSQKTIIQKNVIPKNVIPKNSIPKTFMLTIANGSRYGGDFMVAPRACIDDGLLELVQIKAVTVPKRYFYLPRMKKGRHIGLPFVNYLQVKSLTVITDKPAPAHLDGELFIDTRFEFSVLPGHFIFRY